MMSSIEPEFVSDMITPYGLAATYSNRGCRDYNEDRPIISQLAGGRAHLIAVFDGFKKKLYSHIWRRGFFNVFVRHGGSKSAMYAKENICNIFESSQPWIDIPAALKTTFITLDEKLRSDNDYSGTTATVVILFEDKTIVCANAGDSRAILATCETRFEDPENGMHCPLTTNPKTLSSPREFN
jgi:serine/threonine protein phosphatase PrpC